MQAEVSVFFSAISLEKLQRSSAMPGRVSPTRMSGGFPAAGTSS